MRNNLVELRKKAGFTQEQMGKLINNKTRGHWCNIERGREDLRMYDLFTLGKRFNLTLEELEKVMEVS